MHNERMRDARKGYRRYQFFRVGNERTGTMLTTETKPISRFNDASPIFGVTSRLPVICSQLNSTLQNLVFECLAMRRRLLGAWGPQIIAPKGGK